MPCFRKALLDSWRNRKNAINYNPYSSCFNNHHALQSHSYIDQQFHDLIAFAVYRDHNSWENGREIGRPYHVDRNTTFSQCIKAENAREAFYIENNIITAIENGTYMCENQDEILAHYSSHDPRAYSATMLVPIVQHINTDKCYYGFLCVDAILPEGFRFQKDDLIDVLHSYADILATHFHSINTYFPFIFDYVYNNEVSD